MTFDENTYLLIDQYLQGVMDDSARNTFEDRMRNEPDLAEEVRLHEELINHFSEEWSTGRVSFNSPEAQAYIQFLQSDEADRIKNLIEEGEHQYFHNQPKNWTKLLIAASVTFFLIASVIIYSLVSSAKPDYDQYYSWNELPSLTERSSENTDLARVEVDFRQGDFQKVIDQLSEPKSSSEYFYLAVSQFELGRTESALQTLDKLLQSNLLDRNQAHWYKALIYLRQQQNEQAKRELNIVVNDDTKAFDTEASLILDDLD